ncbi:MAG: hydroxyisourate hydrolase [Gemmatimonadaceae bacterium]|nr:hydroxyisourate hydrolase [Gemmatimonadaceae bacterium]
MSTLSTHVLDTALGRPAEGILVTLERDGVAIRAGETDADGRLGKTDGDAPLSAGEYRLIFSVADYFSRAGRNSFYSDIIVSFRIGAGDEHYHVPLLLSPFGYSTYRGT